MLLIICELIETIVSVAIALFKTAFVVGRIIIHILSNISDVMFNIASVCATFAGNFYEDAKIFMLDIDYQYGHIVKMMNNGISNSISDISQMALATTSSIEWIGSQTKSEIQKMTGGIFNAFTYSATGIRSWIVLIGNSAWMLLMCIPNLVFLMSCNMFKLFKYLSRTLLELCQLTIKLTIDTSSSTVKFFTSVPLQSVCGLISIYFILKYRRFLYRLIRTINGNIARSIYYIVQSIMNVFAAFFEFIMPLPRFISSSNGIATKTIDSSSSPTKSTENNFCVICQDNVKSIVLLPCRHLCLCIDCCRQLKRYRRECPMCRAPYEHSIQVYT